MLAGRGLSAVTVAIGPGVFRGVLPLPASVLKGVGPFLINYRGAGADVTYRRFRFGGHGVALFAGVPGVLRFLGERARCAAVVGC